jgi:hypothetical protein
MRTASVKTLLEKSVEQNYVEGKKNVEHIYFFQLNL